VIANYLVKYSSLEIWGEREGYRRKVLPYLFAACIGIFLAFLDNWVSIIAVMIIGSILIFSLVAVCAPIRFGPFEFLDLTDKPRAGTIKE